MRFVQTQKTKTEQLTGLQETLIRRLNRAGYIVKKDNTLTLTVPINTRAKDGQMLTQTFDRNLLIEKFTGNLGVWYVATVYTRQAVKATYWRKWRPVQTVVEQSVIKYNFNKLLKEISF